MNKCPRLCTKLTASEQHISGAFAALQNSVEMVHKSTAHNVISDDLERCWFSIELRAFNSDREIGW